MTGELVSLPIPARRQAPESLRQMLSHDGAAVVESVRETRKRLTRVTDMVSARKTEVLLVSDDGQETYDMRALTPEERKSQLYKAMTWLNSAEDELRRCRGQLERAIAKAERRIG